MVAGERKVHGKEARGEGASGGKPGWKGRGEGREGDGGSERKGRKEGREG